MLTSSTVGTDCLSNIKLIITPNKNSVNQNDHLIQSFILLEHLCNQFINDMLNTVYKKFEYKKKLNTHVFRYIRYNLHKSGFYLVHKVATEINVMATKFIT